MQIISIYSPKGDNLGQGKGALKDRTEGLVSNLGTLFFVQSFNPKILFC